MSEIEYEYAVIGDDSRLWPQGGAREDAEKFIQRYGGVLYRRPIGEWEKVDDNVGIPDHLWNPHCDEGCCP